MLITLLILIAAFLLGTIVGSFLNVVILRYGKQAERRSIIDGRSQCMVCERELVWYELVPLVSFVVLRGRCRTCETQLSPQYPLVELLTGALFTLVVYTFGLTLQGVLAAVIVSLLIIITVYDLRHLIIPDPFVWTFNGLAFLTLFIDFSTTTLVFPGWMALAAGPLIAAPFALLWLISRGRWMGLGDGKLALGIGWLLYPIGGLLAGVSAILFAFWMGAIVGLLLLLINRLNRKWGKPALGGAGERVTMKSEIPFGPFLVIGTLIVYFFEISIFLL